MTKSLSCFTNIHAKAIPIRLLNSSDFPKWASSADKVTRQWVKAHDYKAGAGELLIIPKPSGDINTVLYGLKEADAQNPWVYAKLAAALPKATYKIVAGDFKISYAAAALGWALAHYRFERYRDSADKTIRKLALSAQNVDLDAVLRDYRAITLVRDLVNTPAEDMGPSALAACVAAVARAHKAKFKAIVGNSLLKQGLPTIHAVGRAAADAPRLIDVQWGRRSAPRLTLVGKGVCFDTGGLDLKPGSGMRLMKKDMGGAAHALALAQMVMEAGLDVRLRLLIPAVENSVSGNAFRPGDVIRTRKGLTVEIDNTDAEGRLVLCDALALADEEKPDLLIDFATLTGAARVALGPDLPAMYGADALTAAVAQAGAELCDPVWRMPLWQPYMRDLQSDIADLLNSSPTPFAGSITAALYLSRFVSDAEKWLHFDLFAWNPNAAPGRPKGGEAAAIRAVFQVLAARYGARA